jgi:hypothetical protein
MASVGAVTAVVVAAVGAAGASGPWLEQAATAVTAKSPETRARACTRDREVGIEEPPASFNAALLPV